MGQVVEKNVYRSLGEKIDNLTAKAPWNERFHEVLKELYTPEEADMVVKMPYTLSSVERIAKITKVGKARLSNMLEKLCKKGLVMDMWNEKDSQYYYMPSPIVIGIFEFTMMRREDNLNTKEWARLFHEYMHGDDSFYAANAAHEAKISVMRVIPIEETIRPDEHIVFLDYEKASSFIENAQKFSIGFCSCRNEKYHGGKKECDAPLESCSAFDLGADMLIRNNMAREVSKSEMLENFARSKEIGLALCSFNVKKPFSICHCCKCCCNYLAGVNKFGYMNFINTSNFISKIDEGLCKGCGKCLEVCPVNAMSLISANDPKNKKKKKSLVNNEICAGCGVCALKCPTSAIKMINRGSRVISPETLFELTMLASLDKGNLQNQIFDNPQSITQKFMRPFIGGFLRLPRVKRALMSDTFRSSFLGFMNMGAKIQGKGWLTKL
jgi:NAD-dependent dihydropyrimidine dehydrogenase PreA subunit/predicted transcriptional regulator